MTREIKEGYDKIKISEKNGGILIVWLRKCIRNSYQEVGC